jgi:hypothetical protein
MPGTIDEAGDADVAAQLGRRRPQLAQQLVLEGALGVDEAEHPAAGVGEGGAGGAAHQQRDLELVLEVGDPARQRRLAEVELGGGGGEAAGPHHRGEGGELVLGERGHHAQDA